MTAHGIHLLFFLEKQVEGTGKLPQIQTEVLVRLLQIGGDVLLGLGINIGTPFFFLLQHLGGILKFLVFQKSCHQFASRILFHHTAVARIHHPRQNHLGFDFDQRRRQHHEFRAHIDIHFLHGTDIGQVLTGDLTDADIINAHFRIFDEIDQQIEGTLKRLQSDFIAHTVSSLLS